MRSCAHIVYKWEVERVSRVWFAVIDSYSSHFCHWPKSTGKMDLGGRRFRVNEKTDMYLVLYCWLVGLYEHAPFVLLQLKASINCLSTLSLKSSVRFTYCSTYSLGSETIIYHHILKLNTRLFPLNVNSPPSLYYCGVWSWNQLIIKSRTSVETWIPLNFHIVCFFFYTCLGCIFQNHL